MKKLRAVLYVRVSSEKQLANTSIKAQKRLGREYCISHDIELVQIFAELGESAKIIDREALQSAIKFCAVRQIDYFLVYKYDRFSRSVENHHKLKAALSRYGVKLVSISEPVEDTPSGRFLENMLAGVAQFDNEVRSERSIKGMKSRLEEGLYPFNAPLGYIDNKNTPGLKHPDPQRFNQLQQAMKMMLTGGYRIYEMTKILSRWGVRTRRGKDVTDKLVGRILRNPFYAGILDCPAFGVRRQGRHQPMITPEEHFQLQQILSRSANHEGEKVKTFNDEFSLNKLILCCGCGKTLSGSWAKKGKRFGYYACRNPKCTDRTKGKKEAIESSFSDLLHRITPSKELVELYKATVIDYLQEKVKDKKKIQAVFQAEVKQLEERQLRVQELLEDGVYNAGQYRERNQTIETELVVKRIQLSEINIDASEMETCLNYSLGFIQQLPKFWMKLASEDKFRLYRFLFPEQLRWQNGRLTTPSLGLVYQQMEGVRRGQKSSGGPDVEFLQLEKYLRSFCSTLKALGNLRFASDAGCLSGTPENSSSQNPVWQG